MRRNRSTTLSSSPLSANGRGRQEDWSEAGFEKTHSKKPKRAMHVRAAWHALPAGHCSLLPAMPGMQPALSLHLANASPSRQGSSNGHCGIPMDDVGTAQVPPWQGSRQGSRQRRMEGEPTCVDVLEHLAQGDQAGAKGGPRPAAAQAARGEARRVEQAPAAIQQRHAGLATLGCVQEVGQARWLREELSQHEQLQPKRAQGEPPLPLLPLLPLLPPPLHAA